jgi:hypothetical protein
VRGWRRLIKMSEERGWWRGEEREDPGELEVSLGAPLFSSTAADTRATGASYHSGRAMSKEELGRAGPSVRHKKGGKGQEAKFGSRGGGRSVEKESEWNPLARMITAAKPLEVAKRKHT